MLAYLEVRSFREFEENVRNHSDRWDDDIQLYKGFSWEDYGREMFDCCCYQMEEHLQDFFDFEAYGRDMGEYAEEYSGGIIEFTDKGETEMKLNTTKQKEKAIAIMKRNGHLYALHLGLSGTAQRLLL